MHTPPAWCTFASSSASSSFCLRRKSRVRPEIKGMDKKHRGPMRGGGIKKKKGQKKSIRQNWQGEKSKQTNS